MFEDLDRRDVLPFIDNIGRARNGIQSIHTSAILETKKFPNLFALSAGCVFFEGVGNARFSTNIFSNNFELVLGVGLITQRNIII